MAQEDSIGNADPSSVADPAHHSSGNDDHTTSTGAKPSHLVEALLDPEFLPSTTKAPMLRKVQAYGVLLALVMGGMVGARKVLSIEILQTEMPIFLATGVAVATTIFAVAGDIDWWELVLAYWWFSLPAGGAMMLLLIVMGENATGMTEAE